jgi:proteasome lid subunit RPN8/RPN11
MINKNVISSMEKAAPNEGCGFILKTGKWVECDNVAGSDDAYPTEHAIAPESAFMISATDYLKYSRDIRYIVHSHISDDPENDEPSIADIMHQKATGVVWIVVVLDVDGKYYDHYKFGESVI